MIADVSTSLTGTDAVAPVVTVVEQASPDHPPTLRLGLRNRTGERLAVRSGPPVPFDDIQTVDGPAPAQVIPTDEPDAASPRDRPQYERASLANGSEECWVVAAGYYYRGAQVLGGREIDGGGMLTVDYAFVVESDAERCFPPGEYRFVSTPHIEWPDYTSRTGDIDTEPFEWTLPVQVGE